MELFELTSFNFLIPNISFWGCFLLLGRKKNDDVTTRHTAQNLFLARNEVKNTEMDNPFAVEIVNLDDLVQVTSYNEQSKPLSV